MSDKSTNKVDKIRDLIFGNQIKDFEAQFDHIDETMKVMEEKMSKALNESYGKLQKETAHSLAMLEKKIDDLSASSVKEKTKLKELIESTDKNLQEQFRDHNDKFITRLEVMKENIAHDNKKISEDMALMQHEIEAALEKKLSSLSDEKLSRDAMANMLVDVAMKMQDKDVTKVANKGKKTGK